MTPDPLRPLPSIPPVGPMAPATLAFLARGGPDPNATEDSWVCVRCGKHQPGDGSTLGATALLRRGYTRMSDSDPLCNVCSPVPRYEDVCCRSCGGVDAHQPWCVWA